MSINKLWNDDEQWQAEKTLWNTCSKATSFIVNLTGSHAELNSKRHVEKLACNHLSYGTTYFMILCKHSQLQSLHFYM
jgi:hypothetical protein